MNTKQLFAFATIALATTGALADDITFANDVVMSNLRRAEVRAQVIEARAAGVLQFSTEMQSQVQAAMPVAKSTLTRQAVRAQLLKGPRVHVGEAYPAA